LEIIGAFFVDITKLKHTVCDFFVEKRNLLFDAVPNAALPFGVVLFLLLEMSHEEGEWILVSCGEKNN
jgi:hypothetical protein